MGTQVEGAGESNAPGGADKKKDNIYENNETSKKIIRVVTVVAYMISVSFVAIVLSAYYVFLWQPPNPRLLHRAHLRADPQMEYLVDKPATEVTPTEALSPAAIRDKVSVFREEILRSRAINMSFRSQHPQPPSFEPRAKNANVSHVNRAAFASGTSRNNSRSSETQFDPVVRILLASTETSTTRTSVGNSTDVYKSSNSAAANSSMDLDSIRPSALFMETLKINGSSSVTRTSSPPSSSSSSSELSESRSNLYNVTMNDFASTTVGAFDIGDTEESTEENRSSSFSLEEFSVVTESSIKGIVPTRAYELLGNLRNSTVGLDRVGSSGSDQPVSGTTMRTSGIAEKTTVRNVVSSAQTSFPPIMLDLDRTVKTNGRRLDNFSTVQSNDRPDIIGSHITRVLTKSPANGTEIFEKLQANVSPEKQFPIEIVPDSTREVTSALNSSASIVPAVVQPDPESIGKEQQPKEHMTQDGDFGFI